jgi:hypothetical protein
MQKVDVSSVPYVMARGEKTYKPEAVDFIKGTAEYRRAERHLKHIEAQRYAKVEAELERDLASWNGEDV